MTPPSQTDPTSQEPPERQIRRLVGDGQLDAGASLYMQSYGGEVLGFLHLCLRDQTEASEVFSEFAEDFWRGLPGFRWRTSIRSWGYTLARNAVCRSRRPKHQKTIPLTHTSQILDHAIRDHSRTPRHMQTEVKDRMRQLRAQLPVDDQSLLVLRIDKGLSWNELASVFSNEGDALSDADRKRWAARLRQRFTGIKAHLRELAEAEGLV